jgi:hypothetical protein
MQRHSIVYRTETDTTLVERAMEVVRSWKSGRLPLGSQQELYVGVQFMLRR